MKYFQKIKLVNVADKTDEFVNSALMINNDLTDSWINFQDNSLASFDNVLIKIYQRKNRRTNFYILKRVSLLSKDNVVTIKHSQPLIKYVYQSNLKFDARHLKMINLEINYLETVNHLNFDPNNTLKLADLYDRKFLLEAQRNFNIRSEE